MDVTWGSTQVSLYTVSMNTFRRAISLLGLLVCFASMSFTQVTTTSPSTLPPVDTSFTYILGTGSGFKPYQASIKDGSSAFVEAGYKINQYLFAFERVNMHSTYAEMMTEACGAFINQGRWIGMACGGVGLGASQASTGVAFDGGGKLLYNVTKKGADGKPTGTTFIGIEMGVTKSTVPAPVTAAATINPVQPDFRAGIYHTF